jgi:hypothetical protein
LAIAGFSVDFFPPPVEANTTGSRSAIGRFEAWLATRDVSSNVGEVPLEVIELAKHRESEMLTLIKTNPREALARAVGYSEYEGLPEVIKVHTERPFSAAAELLALPACTASPTAGTPVMSYELSLGGEHFSASVFGRRQSIDSKQGAPLQGITLAGHAVVRERVLQEVSEVDAGLFPQGQAHSDRCLATGEVLGTREVTAIAGGKQFHFSSQETLEAFEQRIAAFDKKPGPHTGSKVIFLYADGDDGFDWQEAEEDVDLQASTWTETPKDVYFIRVDFLDKIGESVSQVELANYMNTTVSDAISEYSYGKTKINGTVSNIVVRMPKLSTSYASTNNNLLHTDAKAAARSQIPSLDLSLYDIIGVHFVDIGMGASAASSYAGLAGGTRQWIQDNTSSNVMIHEFGHNYGIGHASFWDTSDGSVVGSGSSEEYGDDFDIMGDGGNDAHIGPHGKQKINWLEPAQWTDVTNAGSGTYRVYRFDDAATSGSTRALRITKRTALPEYYWLGYRGKLVDNPWLQAGAYLTWERPDEDRAWLLDTTPDSIGGQADREDGAILPGRTYSDSDAGVHITTIGAGGRAPNEWIDVTVNLGSFSSNRAPTAELSGPSDANARDGVTFSVSDSDPDGDVLAYYWDIGDRSIIANTASQTITWAVGGTYTISVTVSDMKGGKVTRTKTITVSDPVSNWTLRNSGTDNDLYDITSDGTQLLAVGSSGDSVLRSTDGLTWTTESAGPNAYLRAVVWDGSQFIAAGFDFEGSASEFRGSLHTSTDGSSWTLRQRVGPDLNDIATSGSVHVAVGDDGMIWRSTDAITWSPVPSGTTIDLKGVSYGDGTFVAVGSGSPGNSGGTVVVLTSSDGSSWTDTSFGAETLSWQGFYDVEFCNDRFLASGFYSKIRHSTNAGANFLTSRSRSEEIPAFAYGNGIYLAAGTDLDDSRANINLISTDGETWSALDTDPGYARRRAAVFFNDSFFTVGDGGEIWQSDTFGSLPSGGAFADWLASYLPGSTVDSAGLLDPDDDGATNLQEYASGTDPTLASSTALPTASVVGGYLTLKVVKNPAVSDVDYAVQISPDMKTWGTSGSVIVSKTADHLVVRSATPLPAGRQFLRAVYTLAPQ